MIRHTSSLLVALTATVAGLLFAAAPGSAAAPSGPAWSINSIATPTNFVPGDTERPYSYEVTIINNGAASTDGSPLIISDTLPQGLVVKGVQMVLPYEPGKDARNDFGTAAGANSLCVVDEGGGPATVTCEVPEKYPSPPFVNTPDRPSMLRSGEALSIVIAVAPTGVVEGEELINRATVEGGGAAPASVSADNKASAAPAERGFAYFRATLSGVGGDPVGEAASHPFQYTTSFALHTKPGAGGPGASPFVPAGGDVKDIAVALPPGLVGNPLSIARCTTRQFTSGTTKTFSNGKGAIVQGSVNECPDASAVGFVLIQQVEGARSGPTPLYNLVPAPGEPALFGFIVGGIPFYIDTEVRTGGDYGINGVLHNNSEVKRVTAATVTLWGTPADPRHDPLRGSCLVPTTVSGNWSFEECAAGIPPKPFFRVPTSCGNPLESVMSFSTWLSPREFLSEGSGQPGLVGCDAVSFQPTFEARPTTNVADSPSGLSANVHVPQKEHEEPEGLGQADLRDTTVVLPKGLVINPSSANGLAACSPAQVGLTSAVGKAPVTFTPAPAQCPDAARIGSVEVNVPAVDHPLPGSVYVASPHDNPFGTLLAIYIAVNDEQSGVVLKLPGKVAADLDNGQLTTTFAETPQQPFEDFKLTFFGGPLAALRTPAVCGSYRTTSSMTPWSAPASGPPATPFDAYAISRSPNGGPCPTSAGAQPNSPSFRAGTLAPIAGAYSPLLVNLNREDGSQELSSLSLDLPPGLIGKPAGVPYCSDAALATARAKTGRQEQANPSCPAASELGTVTVGAGAGPSPYYTTGRAYLTGPYRGAPLSMAIITPAAAGPYDLGTVVVRTALRIDPETAKVTAVSDTIPHILEGVPLDVRSIAVKVDRPDFTLNPTNCDPLSFDGTWTSLLGQNAALHNRFQRGECRRIQFKPKQHLRRKGGTKRAKYPRLRAVLTMPRGGANIAGTSVALPHSEFLAQEHIRTICTRVQFAAKQCPAGSVYGHVRAISPLVDYPLEGPVYLRSSSHPLPDMVLALRGPAHQPVEIDAVGRVDSVRGGIRVSFETVPDAPVSKLILNMRGGKKGLLVNSRNICKHPGRARAKFSAQNGKNAELRPFLRSRCSKKKSLKHRRGQGGKKHGHR